MECKLKKDWSDYKQIHGGIEAARASFEVTCENLFRKLYPHEQVHTVEVTQGDGGIDVFVGELGVKSITVIQCKFFLDEFGDSQKKQIRESFTSAIENKEYKIKEWILCIPRNLDLKQHKWWNGWKTRQEKSIKVRSGFIKLKSGGELLGLLKDNHLYNEAFKTEDSLKLAQIHETIMGPPETLSLYVTTGVLSQQYDELSIIDYCLSFKNFDKNKRDIQGFLFSRLPTHLHYSDSRGSYELNGIIPIETIKEILLNDDLDIVFMKSEYRKSSFDKIYIENKLKNKIRNKETVDFIAYVCQFCPKTLLRIIKSNEADGIKPTGFSPLKNDLMSTILEDFFSSPEVLLEPDLLETFLKVFGGIEPSLRDQLFLMQLAVYHKIFDYNELSSKYIIQDNPIVEDKSKKTTTFTLNMTFHNKESEVTPPELFLASYRSGIALELNSSSGLKLNIRSENQPEINCEAQTFKIEPHGSQVGNQNAIPLQFGQLDYINNQYIFKMGRAVSRRPANHPLQLSLNKAVKNKNDKIMAEYTLRYSLKHADCRQAYLLCQACMAKADIIVELPGGNQVMNSKDLPFENMFNEKDLPRFKKLYQIQKAYGQEIPYPYEPIATEIYKALEVFEQCQLNHFLDLIKQHKKYTSSQEICLLENGCVTFYNNLTSLEGMHKPRLNFSSDIQSFIDETLDDPTKDMFMNKSVSTTIETIKFKSENDFDLLQYIQSTPPVKSGNDLFQTDMEWGKQQDVFWYFDTPFKIIMTKLNNSGWENDLSFLSEKNDHKRMIYALKKTIEFETDNHEIISTMLNLSWHYFVINNVSQAISVSEEAVNSENFEACNVNSKFLLFNNLGLYYLSLDHLNQEKSEGFYAQAEALLYGLQISEFNKLCDCVIDDLEKFSSKIDESAQEKLHYFQEVQNTPEKYELIAPVETVKENSVNRK